LSEESASFPQFLPLRTSARLALLVCSHAPVTDHFISCSMPVFHLFFNQFSHSSLALLGLTRSLFFCPLPRCFIHQCVVWVIFIAVCEPTLERPPRCSPRFPNRRHRFRGLDKLDRFGCLALSCFTLCTVLLVVPLSPEFDRTLVPFSLALTRLPPLHRSFLCRSCPRSSWVPPPNHQPWEELVPPV